MSLLRRILLLGILPFLLVVFVWVSWQKSLPVFSETFNHEALSKIEIAPIEAAITLAMTTNRKVLLVVEANSAVIKAVDVNQVTGRTFTDSVAAFQSLGVGKLRALVGQAPITEYSWEQLSIPFTPLHTNIAAGTNYSAHAEEVGHAGEPFLFPKLSDPTPWNANVNELARLDHEVELCAVLLNDLAGHETPSLGYVLCGDYTERWMLVKKIDLDAPKGPTGFPEAKSGETLLPVGPFLVVPNSADFYKNIEISLYVNDQLRQRSSASNSIWSPYEILENVFDTCELPYYYYDQTIQITPDCAKLSSGTLILTGTPQGVMFNIMTLWYPGFYLTAGDRVLSMGTYLGYMNNTIVLAE